MIPVDRDGGSALKQLPRAARTAVAQGRLIPIYPEGTRSPASRPTTPASPRHGDLGVPVVPQVALN
jgi:1-acyl-sn-glycerol-3-phosphate acyltransferase